MALIRISCRHAWSRSVSGALLACLFRHRLHFALPVAHVGVSLRLPRRAFLLHQSHTSNASPSSGWVFAWATAARDVHHVPSMICSLPRTDVGLVSVVRLSVLPRPPKNKNKKREVGRMGGRTVRVIGARRDPHSRASVAVDLHGVWGEEGLQGKPQIPHLRALAVGDSSRQSLRTSHALDVCGGSAPAGLCRGLKRGIAEPGAKPEWSRAAKRVSGFGLAELGSARGRVPPARLDAAELDPVVPGASGLLFSSNSKLCEAEGGHSFVGASPIAGLRAALSEPRRLMG